MTPDDEQCLKLGREVVRMIRHLMQAGQGETAYARRCLTFPGGEVYLLLANDPTLADVMDKAAASTFQVENVTPPSEIN